MSEDDGMNRAVYDAVLLLVEELTPDEREALAIRLKDTNPDFPATDDWQARFDVLISGVPVVGELSDRREDWYGNDGR